MLSVYSVLKPSKSGNCTIENNKPSQNLISLDSIKKIYYNPEKNKSLLHTIREKLDFAIQHDDWSLDDMITPSDHNYFVAPVIDCIIYYVTGYLCKQIVRYFKCVTCQSAIKQNINLRSNEPVARLVNLKSKGGLIHPNINFLNFIFKIEQLFSKYCKMADVLELILTDLLNDKLYFPCFQHSEEIIAFTIKYYINMRMRQFSQSYNSEAQKENMKKKDSKIHINIEIVKYKKRNCCIICMFLFMNEDSH